MNIKFLFLTFCLFCALASRAYSQRDTLDPNGPLPDDPLPDPIELDTLTDRYTYPILFIGNLNFDCVPDTVLGDRFNKEQFLPKYIKWGDSASVRCNDSSAYAWWHDSVMVRTTVLEYPHWDFVRGSFSIEKYNQDSIYDLVLNLEGYSIDSTDTNNIVIIPHERYFVIYGQDDLDAFTLIEMDNIDTMQAEPIYAQNIREGVELQNPGIRDPSGFLSYEVMKTNVNLLPLNLEIEKRNTICGEAPNSGYARAYNITGSTAYYLVLQKIGDPGFLREGAGPFTDLDPAAYKFITGRI